MLFFAKCGEHRYLPIYQGTLPWGTVPLNAGFEPQQIDDGLLEVIGLSSNSLALLQVGGHGDRICQCRTVTLTTDKVIPMQMDGEPCRLLPSKIEIRCSHQALVVQKPGRHSGTLSRAHKNAIYILGFYSFCTLPNPTYFDELNTSSVFHLLNGFSDTSAYFGGQRTDQVRLNIFVISLRDYEYISEDALALRGAAIFYGCVSVSPQESLSSVRKSIVQLIGSGAAEASAGNKEESTPGFRLSDSWLFVDCKYGHWQLQTSITVGPKVAPATFPH
ncbi:diacylglycerol kinase accessory domain protein [Opisthorchis viverrini]|uniref:Diacylglycerol kinase accessory domain protein n=1 Tax=Opisthorchis viverrini TaxID=6198 RepID=A0A1S8WJX2_OPIVI|nr:diacylglycerol kinase accessory domain protein [Opisthorchis viverrini]